MDQNKFDKWLRWEDKIKEEISQLKCNHQIFIKLREVVNGNEKICQHPTFVDYLGQT